MPVLVLKLLLTPILIGGPSLAGRKWGAAVAGWLIALPLTTGPTALYLALDHGVAFGRSAIIASTAGNLAIGAFCFAYAHTSRRLPWFGSIGAGAVAFVLISIVSQPFLSGAFLGVESRAAGGDVAVLTLGSALLAAAFVAAGITTAVLLMPPGAPRQTHAAPPKWDIPFRILLGTLVILVITGIAPYVGPTADGLIASFPVFSTILTVFTQLREGVDQSIRLLRGLEVGLFGTAASQLTLWLALGAMPLVPAFLLAAAVALGAGFLTFRLLPRDEAADAIEVEVAEGAAG
jgi:hypothetical protein